MKKILKHTWAILNKKEKRRFGILIFLNIFISIVDIFSLVLLLWIIQFYIQPGATTQASFLPVWLADRNSIALIAAYLLLFGFKNLAAYLVSKAHYKFISRVAIRISANNLANYQRASFTEFVNTDSSVYIRKIGFQPLEFCQHVLSGIPQIITQSVLILFTVIAIVLFNAKLFLLLLLILLPPVIAVFYFIRARLNKIRSQITTANESSFQHLLDALKGYIESNVYDRNDFFLRRFTKSRTKLSTSFFDSVSIQELPPRVIEVFAVLGLFILIIIAKWNGGTNGDFLITIGAFIGAAYKIIPGIVKIINVSGQVKAYELSVTDIVTEQKIDTKKKEAVIDTLQSIQLKNISFGYGTKTVLEEFSVCIQQGDMIGIAGKSGKGKTTLLNLLLGFLPANKGEIIINSVSTNQESIQNCWSRISYVKQQPFFIHDTILRNITLEEDGHNNERLQFAIEASGLDKLVATSPEGIEKMIMENGKNISGGQRQRIAVARALYKDADLFILDEPFSELDEESECRLLRSLQQMTQNGKMILLITHRSASLSACNKTVSL